MDSHRFQVPGGHIDVVVTNEGRLRIHGVAEYGTHRSQLQIVPESANDATVSLVVEEAFPRG